ncbi:hypothetical protein MA16_Dca026118 [Dendrobium catenatum]|uniref:Uncharacterized protein n=1 Tax=Dendrobium catenatum TaxID=906689 RepID=A0A2I0WDN7_9ASPA|nr:hypothetical protein MA16_Dca026118 [Dendrobium catenatum]
MFYMLFRTTDCSRPVFNGLAGPGRDRGAGGSSSGGSYRMTTTLLAPKGPGMGIMWGELLVTDGEGDAGEEGEGTMLQM